ncbi:MAG: hypothetical protein MZV63_72220 [Marinilabiliales bacterium]|nr:hypothetical protein [Marinilabiliales bacterium]
MRKQVFASRGCAGNPQLTDDGILHRICIIACTWVDWRTILRAQESRVMPAFVIRICAPLPLE